MGHKNYKKVRVFIFNDTEYQAISRRNYVRFVRERAAELHGQKVEIDATQAAIRIQAVSSLLSETLFTILSSALAATLLENGFVRCVRGS